MSIHDDNTTEHDEREAKRIEHLDAIGLHLEGLKETAVRWRTEYEMEWMADYEQYNGSSRALRPAKREGSAAAEEPAYRQTSDNITRPKVIITASRLGDMLFPTNEANWALEASPWPDIPDEMVPPPPPGPDGQQAELTPEMLEMGKREIAKKKARAMSRKIEDQFAESRYAEHGRNSIFDGCLYGTGVLKGPVLKNKRRHTYQGQSQGYKPEMRLQAKPTVEQVDLWSFFPQPCRSVEEMEHAFELHVMPPTAIRKLRNHPGFDSKQLARLLEQEPVHGSLASAAMERGMLRPDAHIVLSGRYAVWEFRGPLPKTAFRDFVEGLVVQGELPAGKAEAMVRKMEEDRLHDVDCEVWFSQGIVLKMAMSTRPTGDLGYHVWNYEKNPNSIFGHGVPYLCRDDQHAANQLWHAIMLNSLMSAGPQIGVRKGALTAQPGDGRSTVFSADRPRVWALDDDTQDINKALSVFIVPNVTDKIGSVYDRAKANADEHTMTPMIAQGEPTSAVPTSSGMAMLMNAANVVMRRLAKSWDDDITTPLLTSFYDWNMQFDPDESIKGDYCVIAKGSSHLLIKDVQTQHLQFATQMFSANPMLAPYMKPRTFAERNIQMLDLVPEELLYTDAEMQEQARQQGEQPDPETMKAQAAMATAQAQQARAEAEAKMTEHRIQWEREERQIAHAERMRDIEARENVQKLQFQGQLITRQTKLMEMEASERSEMLRVIADLEKNAAALDAQQYDIDSRVAIEAEKIASNENKVDKEIKAEGKKAKIQ